MAGELAGGFNQIRWMLFLNRDLTCSLDGRPDSPHR